MIIAVDFDGTLCEHEFPIIGKQKEKHKDLLKKLIQSQLRGNKIILHTCREGVYLAEAVDWCEKQGLYFNAVNENLEELFPEIEGHRRKIYADIYIDDRAVHPEEFIRGVNALLSLAKSKSNT